MHRELHTRNKTLVVFGMWHSATKTDRWLRADDYFGIDYTDVSGGAAAAQIQVWCVACHALRACARPVRVQ